MPDFELTAPDDSRVHIGNPVDYRLTMTRMNVPKDMESGADAFQFLPQVRTAKVRYTIGGEIKNPIGWRMCDQNIDT